MTSSNKLSALPNPYSSVDDEDTSTTARRAIVVGMVGLGSAAVLAGTASAEERDPIIPTASSSDAGATAGAERGPSTFTGAGTTAGRSSSVVDVPVVDVPVETPGTRAAPKAVGLTSSWSGYPDQELRSSAQAPWTGTKLETPGTGTARQHDEPTASTKDPDSVTRTRTAPQVDELLASSAEADEQPRSSAPVSTTGTAVDASGTPAAPEAGLLAPVERRDAQHRSSTPVLTTGTGAGTPGTRTATGGDVLIASTEAPDAQPRPAVQAPTTVTARTAGTPTAPDAGGLGAAADDPDGEWYPRVEVPEPTSEAVLPASTRPAATDPAPPATRALPVGPARAPVELPVAASRPTGPSADVVEVTIEHDDAFGELASAALRTTPAWDDLVAIGHTPRSFPEPRKAALSVAGFEAPDRADASVAVTGSVSPAGPTGVREPVTVAQAATPSAPRSPTTADPRYLVLTVVGPDMRGPRRNAVREVTEQEWLTHQRQGRFVEDQELRGFPHTGRLDPRPEWARDLGLPWQRFVPSVDERGGSY